MLLLILLALHTALAVALVYVMLVELRGDE